MTRTRRPLFPFACCLFNPSSFDRSPIPDAQIRPTLARFASRPQASQRENGIRDFQKLWIFFCRLFALGKRKIPGFSFWNLVLVINIGRPRGVFKSKIREIPRSFLPLAGDRSINQPIFSPTGLPLCRGKPMDRTVWPREFEQLLNVGIALSSVHDLEKLLDLILLEARSADPGRCGNTLSGERESTHLPGKSMPEPQ